MESNVAWMPKTPLTAFSTRAHDFPSNFLNQSIVYENVSARSYILNRIEPRNNTSDGDWSQKIFGFFSNRWLNQISRNVKNEGEKYCELCKVAAETAAARITFGQCSNALVVISLRFFYLTISLLLLTFETRRMRRMFPWWEGSQQEQREIIIIIMIQCSYKSFVLRISDIVDVDIFTNFRLRSRTEFFQFLILIRKCSNDDSILFRDFIPRSDKRRSFHVRDFILSVH